MPEIAEVETVKRTLLNKILNKKIKKIDILYQNIISSKSLDINLLINETFQDIKRAGKWLIFETEKYALLSHLRMEGKFFLKNKEEKVEKHEHVIFTFNDSSDLRYHDTRKFGRMILCLKEDAYFLEEIKKQGYEPLDINLTKEYLYEKIKSSNIAIKTLLLDQTIISGLGNIYANEVLFEAKINPLKKGSELSLKECQNIIDAANKIIPKAIELGGTTIKSYTSSLGVTGRFQQELKVHKKKGEKCLVCKSNILVKKVNGRSTYYCNNCQK